MNFQRFKSIVHPQGYGFWADPDGAFTLLGSIALTIAVVTTTRMSDIVVEIGETWRSVVWDGPPVRIALLLFVVFLARMTITDPLPTDFSKTGRFHLWAVTVGITLVLGPMMIWNWPGLDYDRGAPLFDWSMRWCAVVFYVFAVGLAIRTQMIARQAWIQAEIERLGTAEWTEQITSR